MPIFSHIQNGKIKQIIVIFAAVIAFLALHLWGINQLPVFADEAIYIRWSQLIIDDPKYLFFSLNDGKTPLFMWLLVPTQLLNINQLLAARYLSVLIGLVQTYLIYKLVKQLGGKQNASWLAAILTSILPFWFFYHRLAIIDGLLSVWITLVLLATVKLGQQKSIKNIINNWQSICLLGLGLGASLWTKLPAILIIPALWPVLFWHKPYSWPAKIKLIMQLSLAVFLGLVIFASLKLSPAFGQLFSRGGDFLFSYQEILAGEWQTVVRQIPKHLSMFASYLTWPVLLAAVAGMFTKRRRDIALLLAMGVTFIAPMMLFGKVVYPRYFLPFAIFITTAASLTAEIWIEKARQVQLTAKHAMLGLVLALALATTASASWQFIVASATSPATLPLVETDRVQYLSDWAAGYGTEPTAQLIREAAKNSSIAVATEGYFGSLPDGLLMYFHRRSVDNIYIEGIGQPVRAITAQFADRASNFDQQWLVVNSHRLDLDLPKSNLLAEFCRPLAGPCLQVWDITGLDLPVVNQ